MLIQLLVRHLSRLGIAAPLVTADDGQGVAVLPIEVLQRASCRGSQRRAAFARVGCGQQTAATDYFSTTLNGKRAQPSLV